MLTQSSAQPKKLEVYSALENEFDLANAVCVERNGQTMWALLNSKSGLKQFVFGFFWQPTHESQITLEGVKAIRAGIKELLPLDKLTFISRSQADDEQRQADLIQLAASADKPETRFFVYSEQHRSQELTQQGIRKEKESYIFFTYTVNPTTAETTDKLEAIAAWGEKLWHRHFTAKGEELDQKEKVDLLYSAFSAWQERYQLLTTKMRLLVSPMDGQALWLYLWKLFNGKQPPLGLSHWLFLNAKGELTEEYLREKLGADKAHPVAVLPGYETHMSSLLLGENLPVPSPACDSVYLPNRDCYMGILAFNEPPEGWEADPLGSRWLWDEVIASPKVVDVEIVTQFGWVNSDNNLASLQKFTKQQLGTKARAREKNNEDVGSVLQASEATDAQESLIRGDTPVQIACVIVVYAKTEADLDDTLRHIKNKFSSPAKVVRDRNYPWRTWLQTMPLRWEELLGQPQDFRMRLRISDAVNFIQGVTTRSRGKRGIEFIAERGGSPIHISLEDGMGSPRHGIITGRSGSGKSCMSGGILNWADAQNMTITLVDLPKGNGTSTYKWFVNFLGGAEFDTGKSSNNLMEVIDVRHLPQEVQGDRLESFYKNTINIVLSLILDNRPDSEPLPISAIQSLVGMGVMQFYRDPIIQKRSQAALDAGIGTAAWRDWPVLVDLYRIFDKEVMDLSDFGADVDRALNFIKLRLRYWLSSPFGQAICNPSSFDGRRSRIKLFSLRDLSSDEEAGIMGASAQTAATRSALSASRSFYYIDEASVLLTFPELAKSAGFLFATARGAGMSLLLATQDPNILAECAGSSKILQNTSYKITGRVAPTAIPSYERIFQYPHHLIAPNAEEGFAPSSQGLFSRWLVDDDGIMTPCRFYTPYNLIGITANNRHEIDSRDEYFAKYRDKYEALGMFSEHYVDCGRAGKKL